MTSRPRRHANQPRSKKSNAPAKRPAAKRVPDAAPRQPPLPLNVDLTSMQAIEYRELKFSGPVPPPEILAQYDSVQPGMSADIVQMAKDEQAFRHRIVEKAVDANIKSDRRGQWMAVTVALVGLVVALVLGLSGHAVAGVIIGSLDLAGVVGVFLKGRSDDAKEAGSPPQ